MAETFTFHVEESGENVRIDQFLAENTEFSRTFLRKNIKNGNVRIGKEVVDKPASLLHMGDEIFLYVPDEKPLNLEAEEHGLTLYYEDEHLMVVEKPAGMVVHPSGKRVSGTLVNALLAHFQEGLSDHGGVLRPGIVHRLDEDTSGLMIVAKNNQAHKKLAALFESREIQKTYITLLDGVLTPLEGSIDAPLSRSSETSMRVSASQGSKHALTHYTVMEHLDAKYSLVSVQIVTGRTHQIRVHFSAINHPVIGDSKYGFSKVNDIFAKEHGLTRQFLHAHKLSFTHPFTNESLTFESPLPDDLKKVIDDLHGEQ